MGQQQADGGVKMTAAPPRFVQLVTTITSGIENDPVHPALVGRLSAAFPADGPVFGEIESLCR